MGAVQEHLMTVQCVWLIDNGIRRWRNRRTHISRSVRRSRLWGAFSGTADLGHAGADAGRPWETAGQRDVALAGLGEHNAAMRGDISQQTGATWQRMAADWKTGSLISAHVYRFLLCFFPLFLIYVQGFNAVLLCSLPRCPWKCDIFIRNIIWPCAARSPRYRDSNITHPSCQNLVWSILSLSSKSIISQGPSSCDKSRR